MLADARTRAETGEQQFRDKAASLEHETRRNTPRSSVCSARRRALWRQRSRTCAHGTASTAPD
jgi:hypothetical protein